MEREEEITVEKDVQVVAEERLEEVDQGSNPQESKPSRLVQDYQRKKS